MASSKASYYVHATFENDQCQSNSIDTLRLFCLIPPCHSVQVVKGEKQEKMPSITPQRTTADPVQETEISFQKLKNVCTFFEKRGTCKLEESKGGFLFKTLKNVFRAHANFF